MGEIEKMYENAGIKPTKNWQSCRNCKLKTETRYDDWGEEYLSCKRLERPKKCPDAKEFYPLFTAEKQLAIENIIFQCNFGVCELQRTMPAEFTKENRFVKHYFSWEYHAGDIGYYDETTEEPYGDWDVEYSNPNREEALAGFVNALWDEHLAEEEKQQVKGILE